MLLISITCTSSNRIIHSYKIYCIIISMFAYWIAYGYLDDHVDNHANQKDIFATIKTYAENRPFTPNGYSSFNPRVTTVVE